MSANTYSGTVQQMYLLDGDVPVGMSMSDHGVWRFHALLHGGDKDAYMQQAQALGEVIAHLAWRDEIGMQHVYITYRPRGAVYPAHVVRVDGNDRQAWLKAIGFAAAGYRTRTNHWPTHGVVRKMPDDDLDTVQIVDSQGKAVSMLHLTAAPWMAEDAVYVFREAPSQKIGETDHEA